MIKDRTLVHIDKSVWKKYKEYCIKEKFVLSRKLDLIIESFLEEQEREQ